MGVKSTAQWYELSLAQLPFPAFACGFPHPTAGNAGVVCDCGCCLQQFWFNHRRGSLQVRSWLQWAATRNSRSTDASCATSAAYLCSGVPTLQRTCKQLARTRKRQATTVTDLRSYSYANVAAGSYLANPSGVRLTRCSICPSGAFLGCQALSWITLAATMLI